MRKSVTQYETPGFLTDEKGQPIIRLTKRKREENETQERKESVNEYGKSETYKN